MSVPFFRGSTVCLDTYTIVDHSTGRHTQGRPSTIHEQIGFIIYYVFNVKTYRFEGVSTSELNEVYLISFAGENSSVIPGSVVLNICTKAKLESCLDFASEIATMQYIEANSEIRTPKIYAYCSNDRFFGLRFLIHEHITPGVPLRVVFPTLSEPARFRFIQSFAAVVHSLSKLRFSSIGALQRSPTGRISIGAPSRYAYHMLRRGVPSHPLMHYAHFSRTLNWLMCTARDQATGVGLADPVGANETAAVQKRVVDAMRKIMEWLPSVIEWYDPTPGICSLFPGNMLVMPSGPDAGRILALDNWEGINALPLWVSCQLPTWLDPSVDLNSEYEHLFRVELGKLDDEGLFVRVLQMEQLQGIAEESSDTLDMLRSLVHIIEYPNVVELENWLRIYEPALKTKRRQQQYEQQGQPSGSGSGSASGSRAAGPAGPSTARQQEKQPEQQPAQQPTQKKERKERGGWFTDGEAVKKKAGKKKTKK